MVVNTQFWLGKPNGRSGMRKLPKILAGHIDPMNRSEKAGELLSGGVGTVKAPLPKRQWPLKSGWLGQEEQDIIRGFYLGLWDKGPFRFIDPSEVNLIDLDGSTMGRAAGIADFWVPSGTAMGRDSATISFPNTTLYPTVQMSDAIFTTTLVNGSYIGSTTSDLTRRIPRIPGMDYDFSVWIIGSTATFSMRCSLIGTNTVNGTTVPITTTYQRLTVHATDAALGAYTPWIDMRFTVTALTGTPILSARAAQLSISETTLPFSPGLGVPNVSIISGLEQETPRQGRRSPSWTLAEV